MLEFIRGKLIRRAPTDVVLDVGGVGFRVLVPMSTSSALAGREPGAEVELLLALNISPNEPQLRLFGFLTEAERVLFGLLTSVKGVGPGVAVRILSGASVEELRDAILAQDGARLTRVKGIGKKTAERILFDLKGKVAVLGELIGDPLSAVSSSQEEALTAMSALGYDARIGRKAVEAATKKLGEAASSEELVRLALQQIS